MSLGVRILHANSNTLVRAGLKAILSKGGGVDHLGEATDSKGVFQSIVTDLPDLLIIDSDQNEFAKDDVLGKVRLAYPDLKTLVISDENDHTKIIKVVESGVQGYLTRECDEDEIINAIFAIHGGEKFYCNKVINVILDRTLAPNEEDCEPTSLSERENEVIALIAGGLTSKAIAEELNISPHTVQTHRKNIMKKLNVNSTSGLVLYAVNAGLINPTEL